MSGYARAASALGASVSGSDGARSTYTDRLPQDGILTAQIGHRAENVPQGDDVVLFYSTAVAAENVERVAARERGIPELPRADLLAELSAMRRTIAVAGTHGKTTTSSMLVHALRGAGLDPGWLIGGSVGGELPNSSWSGRRVAGGRGRRVGPLDAQPRRRDRGADERRARAPRHIRLARGAARGVRRAARGRARRPSCGIAPSCCRCATGTLVAYDATDVTLTPGGSRFQLARERGDARRAGRPQRARRDGCARGGAAGGSRGGAGRLPRWRASRARAAAFSGSGSAPAARVVYEDYAHHPTEIDGDPARRADARAQPAGGRVPAPPVLAHGAARPRVRQGAGARGRGLRARRLPCPRARGGLPGRQRADDRRGRRGRRLAGARSTGFRASPRPSRCSAGTCAPATCAS